ncbi:MAG: hypothetical protein M1834_003454 [Cirrosporium novae-zelandiae]|nr:MAG: hypothetical protein M1834_003454 [Cirrosporium novae-zelandiae]
MTPSFRLFTIIWLYRYIRFVVNCLSSWTFKPYPLPEKPTYFPEDVTIIIPTTGRVEDDWRLHECIISCLRTKPWAIMIVTVNIERERLARLVKAIDSQIQVLSIGYANKRHQLCHAIPKVRTRITVLADDDVIWPQTLLRYVLAPFEDGNVGAVGTFQCVRHRHDLGTMGTIWQYLGACYIERRNFEISATSHIDGGISCLSGRTSGIRTGIIQSNEFLLGYANERWLGRQLKPDDDNYVTRFLVSNAWNIQIQAAREAELLTTLETNPKFLHQCLRWARSNWRSNITSLIYERHVWRRQLWCVYSLYFSMFTHSLIHDLLMFFLLYTSIEDANDRRRYIHLFLFWLLITKVTKLLPHFARHPSDIFMIPVTIVFGYLHGLIKYYALFTLHVSAWGSRMGDTGQERMA